MLVVEKAVFGLCFGAMFATLVLLARRYFPSRFGRCLWLAAVPLACISGNPDMGPDALYYLTILLAAHHLLTRDRYPSHRVLDVLLFCLLAVIALGKNTNLILIGLLLGSLVLQNLVKKRFHDLFWDCGSFVAAFLVFWLLAGQRLENIPHFLSNMTNVSGDYAESMGYSAPGIEFLVGLALGVWGLFFAANLVRLWLFQRYSWRVLLFAFEFALLFLVWKHGYIRADQHLMHFWTLIPAASVLFFLAHEQRAASVANESCQDRLALGQKRMPNAGWNLQTMRLLEVECVFVLTMCALLSTAMARALSSSLGHSVAEICSLKVKRIGEDIQWLYHPRRRLARLEKLLRDNRDAAAMPASKAAVGAASVDFFGWTPGYLMLNDLKYKPRPMPFSINAVSEAVMQANAEFYRNDSSAPQYVMAGIGATEDQLPPQNDALALLEVIRHYRPIIVEQGLLLLKCTAAGPDKPPVHAVSTRQCAWNDRVELPPSDGRFLWCRVDINYSAFGRLRSFLYKPQPVTILLESDGKITGKYRFLTCEGKTGFLISPLITNNVDLLLAYPLTNKVPVTKTPQPDAIRFMTVPSARSDFAEEITVTFFSLEKPEW